MARPTHATISYESFQELWKRLVSKKKARRFDVDAESAWAQLGSDGRLSLRKRERAAEGAGNERPAGTTGDEGAHRPAARQATSHAHASAQASAAMDDPVNKAAAPVASGPSGARAARKAPRRAPRKVPKKAPKKVLKKVRKTTPRKSPRKSRRRIAATKRPTPAKSARKR
jgi:hypothetical protein